MARAALLKRVSIAIAMLMLLTIPAMSQNSGLSSDLAEKIDKGLTDKQILEELLTEHGPELLRQHLLP